MSNIINKLKPGDLIAVAYRNCTFPSIYHKNTGVSVQYYEVRKYTLQDFKKNGVKNTYKNYINSWDRNYRVVKITEDSLTDEDLAIYKEMKALYEGIPLQP
jgi:hypothetical protein